MRPLNFIRVAIFSFGAALGIALVLFPPARARTASDWIADGLALERAGDLPAAERALLTAAELDRRYLPAWTLANYYYRRSDKCGFADWSRRASAMQYDDARPLLRLLQGKSMEGRPK